DGRVHAGVADAQADVTVGGLDTGDRQVVVRAVGVNALPHAAATAPGNIHSADGEVRVVRQADGEVGNGSKSIRGVVDEESGAGGTDELPGHVVEPEARNAVRHDVARTLYRGRAAIASAEVVQEQPGV